MSSLDAPFVPVRATVVLWSTSCGPLFSLQGFSSSPAVPSLSPRSRIFSSSFFYPAPPVSFLTAAIPSSLWVSPDLFSSSVFGEDFFVEENSIPLPQNILVLQWKRLCRAVQNGPMQRLSSFMSGKRNTSTSDDEEDDVFSRAKGYFSILQARQSAILEEMRAWSVRAFPKMWWKERVVRRETSMYRNKEGKEVKGEERKGRKPIGEEAPALDGREVVDGGKTSSPLSLYWYPFSMFRLFLCHFAVPWGWLVARSLLYEMMFSTPIHVLNTEGEEKGGQNYACKEAKTTSEGRTLFTSLPFSTPSLPPYPLLSRYVHFGAVRTLPWDPVHVYSVTHSRFGAAVGQYEREWPCRTTAAACGAACSSSACWSEVQKDTARVVFPIVKTAQGEQRNDRHDCVSSPLQTARRTNLHRKEGFLSTQEGTCLSSSPLCSSSSFPYFLGMDITESLGWMVEPMEEEVEGEAYRTAFRHEEWAALHRGKKSCQREGREPSVRRTLVQNTSPTTTADASFASPPLDPLSGWKESNNETLRAQEKSNGAVGGGIPQKEFHRTSFASVSSWSFPFIDEACRPLWYDWLALPYGRFPSHSSPSGPAAAFRYRQRLLFWLRFLQLWSLKECAIKALGGKLALEEEQKERSSHGKSAMALSDEKRRQRDSHPTPCNHCPPPVSASCVEMQDISFSRVGLLPYPESRKREGQSIARKEGGWRETFDIHADRNARTNTHAAVGGKNVLKEKEHEQEEEAQGHTLLHSVLFCDKVPPEEDVKVPVIRRSTAGLASPPYAAVLEEGERFLPPSSNSFSDVASASSVSKDGYTISLCPIQVHISPPSHARRQCTCTPSPMAGATTPVTSANAASHSLREERRVASSSSASSLPVNQEEDTQEEEMKTTHLGYFVTLLFIPSFHTFPSSSMRNAFASPSSPSSAENAPHCEPSQEGEEIPFREKEEPFVNGNAPEILPLSSLSTAELEHAVVFSVLLLRATPHSSSFSISAIPSPCVAEREHEMKPSQGQNCPQKINLHLQYKEEIIS